MRNEIVWTTSSPSYWSEKSHHSLKEERVEVAVVFANHLGVAGVQKGQRPLCRTDVNRLPEAVQHKHQLSVGLPPTWFTESQFFEK